MKARLGLALLAGLSLLPIASFGQNAKQDRAEYVIRLQNPQSDWDKTRKLRRDLKKKLAGRFEVGEYETYSDKREPLLGVSLSTSTTAKPGDLESYVKKELGMPGIACTRQEIDSEKEVISFVLDVLRASFGDDSKKFLSYFAERYYAGKREGWINPAGRMKVRSENQPGCDSEKFRDLFDRSSIQVYYPSETRPRLKKLGSPLEGDVYGAVVRTKMSSNCAPEAGEILFKRIKGRLKIISGN